MPFICINLKPVLEPFKSTQGALNALPYPNTGKISIKMVGEESMQTLKQGLSSSDSFRYYFDF